MIEIKPFDMEHVSTHYKWNNDKELSYYDSEYPHIHESFEDFIKRIKEVNDEGNNRAQLLEIIHTETGELIGIVDIHAIDHHHKRCFVNCTIGDRRFRGQGHGKTTLLKVLSYCFEELGMRKVATTAFDFNEKWINLVQKMGFQKEGELRKHVLKENTYHNKLIFSMLEEEYAELHQKETVAAE